jgi:hypothetical protein
MKPKRPSGREEFERVYLRENQIKRTLDSIPQEVINDHLNDKSFLSTTAYIARNTFFKNKNTLLAHGFEQEDLESISRLYGLSFLSSDFGNKTGKDKYYLMMRYINQRFEAFFLFFDRKFDISTKIPEISLEQFPISIAESLTSRISTSDLVSNINELSQEDLIELIDDLKLKIKISSCKSDKKILSNQLKGFSLALLKLKKKNKAENSKQKKLSAELKKKFTKDWDKYIDQLCYYSTSKHVPNDVRKKARSFCNKYKVDFIAWAKNKVKSNLDSEFDFVLS